MLFHHVCALENSQSQNQLKRFVDSNRTAIFNTTAEIPNLNSTFTTSSNTTVSSKNKSTVDLSNSTKQSVKSSFEDALARHIISEELGTQEDVKTETKFVEISIHSDGSHSDLIQTPRISDFEDSGSQIDPKDPVFNRDDFDESPSKESKKFVHRSDSVVHNKYIPDISLSYILVTCCVVVILILCIWKPLCHILYNLYTSCRLRPRASSIDTNSKVAYRQLNTHEF
ncbi:hypothetical protein KSF78_0008358 [Schistosoma japonicum]|nr:hypothetical protein KSF78_0008358 [Schistosoma japonicum]KAH8874412.1 hypothetical protein KSF78_0008358 [Schistosoma japonicum]